MATLNTTTRRTLLAGAFTLAVAAAPLATVLSGTSGSAPAVASCPNGEVTSPTTGECQAPATFNPINPEKNQLETGEITSSRAGDVGTLPEVNGIPCTGSHGGGGSTGQCIGLQENAVPTLKAPLPPQN